MRDTKSFSLCCDHRRNRRQEFRIEGCCQSDGRRKDCPVVGEAMQSWKVSCYIGKTNKDRKVLHTFALEHGRYTKRRVFYEISLSSFYSEHELLIRHCIASPYRACFEAHHGFLWSDYMYTTLNNESWTAHTRPDWLKVRVLSNGSSVFSIQPFISP